MRCRVIRKVPDAIESFQDVAAKLLMDRHHGVLLTGVALMMEICEVDPATVEAYRKHVPQLCNIIRSLLMSGFAPEHDVSGTTDPFLQVKVSCHNSTLTLIYSILLALQVMDVFVHRSCSGSCMHCLPLIDFVAGAPLLVLG